MYAKTRLAALIVLSVLGIAGGESFAFAEDVAGTYTGNNIKLELKSAGAEEYSGTIHFAGSSFPATVSTTDKGLSGTFQSQGQPFQFQLVPTATVTRW